MYIKNNEYDPVQEMYHKTKKKYDIVEHDFTSHIPFKHIRRINQYDIGYGVLGRYFPASGQIDVVDWLDRDGFEEVYTHEVRHSMNPLSSEKDVRDFTKNIIGKSKYH